MRWNTVKKRVADEVYTGILHNSFNYDAVAATLMDAVAECRTVRESAADLAFRCHEIIMNWDVRSVGRLRDLFPQYFPHSLKRGPLKAYMEDCDGSPWVVERA